MFQKSEEMIIVVAPKIHQRLARQLVHELIKMDNINAAYWDIKEFENNEKQLGSAHRIITIGDSQENNLTKDYSAFVGLEYDEAGICYGFDGNKAIIYANKSKIDKKETLETAKKLKLVSPQNITIGVTSGVLFGGLLINVLLVLWSSLVIVNSIKRKKEMNQLIQLTTSLSTDLFLQEGLEKWLSIDEGDQF